tara:strand:+ start:31 stop:393 length:363 start_codon:yes stop_codon:yes gene_type:complete
MSNNDMINNTSYVVMKIENENLVSTYNNKMTNCTEEIRNTYFPEYRLHMTDIFDELLYVTNTTCCDNENCEREIDKNNAIYQKISWLDCHFCSEPCQNYGNWSIRYDIRKKKIEKPIYYY